MLQHIFTLQNLKYQVIEKKAGEGKARSQKHPCLLHHHLPSFHAHLSSPSRQPCLEPTNPLIVTHGIYRKKNLL